jgi:plastocyanin
MRAILALGISLAFFAFAACSSSSTASGTTCSTSGAAATVTASDGLTFAPATATITHGQSICWQNSGSIAHTVTSNDGTSFSTNLAAGQLFLHTFATAGTFAYHCTIHAGMNGTIIVN